MATAAKHRAACPVCSNVIEVGELIAKAPQGWVHAGHGGDAAPGGPVARTRYKSSVSVEDNLDLLVEELGEIYPGCVGLLAEFRSTYNTLVTTALYLRWESNDEAISDDAFRAAKPYLYKVACNLMAELGYNSWDETFSDASGGQPRSVPDRRRTRGRS